MFRLHIVQSVLVCDGVSMDEQREFSMESTLEVLTTSKSRREGHRHWPDEVKVRRFGKPRVP